MWQIVDIIIFNIIYLLYYYMSTVVWSQICGGVVGVEVNFSIGSTVHSRLNALCCAVHWSQSGCAGLDCLVCHYTAIACGYSQYKLATTTTSTTTSTTSGKCSTLIHHAANGIFVYILSSFKNTLGLGNNSGSQNFLRAVTCSMLVIMQPETCRRVVSIYLFYNV